MAKRKNKLHQSMPIWLTLLGLIGLVALIMWMMRGRDVMLFNPKGHVARQEMRLMIYATALLMEICIPTLVVLYYVAWKYREGNQKAQYEPNTKHGKSFLVFVWGVPIITMILMTALLIPATYKLQPQKSLAAEGQPIVIQVVALRWKWLFIYPEQNIATVNYVQIPVNAPVKFELTGDESPMSSFWIPHLGGQLYAMTGHVNPLNLSADTPGDYQGSVAEINGDGFAGMRFTTHVGSRAEFDQWVQSTAQSPDQLTSQQYQRLLVPSQDNPPAFYSNPAADLYSTILTKNAGSHPHAVHQ